MALLRRGVTIAITSLHHQQTVVVVVVVAAAVVVEVFKFLHLVKI